MGENRMNRAGFVLLLLILAAGVAAEERFVDSMGLASIEVPAGWIAWQQQGVVLLGSTAKLKEAGPMEGEVLVPFYYMPATSLLDEWGVQVEQGTDGAGGLAPELIEQLLLAIAGSSNVTDPQVSVVEAGDKSLVKLSDSGSALKIWASAPEPGVIAIFMPQATPEALAAHSEPLHAALGSLRLELPLDEFNAAFGYEPSE